jgi:hypothetical protein
MRTTSDPRRLRAVRVPCACRPGDDRTSLGNMHTDDTQLVRRSTGVCCASAHFCAALDYSGNASLGTG